MAIFYIWMDQSNKVSVQSIIRFLRKFRLINFKMAAILNINMYRNGTMLSILSHHVSPDGSQQGLVLLNSTHI